MFLVQELYYITSGEHRIRKSMTALYQITNDEVWFVDVLEGEPYKVMPVLTRVYGLYGHVFQILPSVETTPSFITRCRSEDSR